MMWQMRNHICPGSDGTQIVYPLTYDPVVVDSDGHWPLPLWVVQADTAWCTGS